MPSPDTPWIWLSLSDFTPVIRRLFPHPHKSCHCILKLQPWFCGPQARARLWHQEVSDISSVGSFLVFFLIYSVLLSFFFLFFFIVVFFAIHWHESTLYALAVFKVDMIQHLVTLSQVCQGELKWNENCNRRKADSNVLDEIWGTTGARNTASGLLKLQPLET